MEEPFGEVIFSYSRKQAIEDGVLIEIDQIASDCGFKIPTVISSRLLEELGEDLDKVEQLLVEFHIVIASQIRMGKVDDRVYLREYVLHIGGDDEGKPVLTLCHIFDL